MAKRKLVLVEFFSPMFMFIFGLAVVGGLFFFRLGSSPPGYASSELQTVTQVRGRSLSAEDILDNPLFLPHKVGQYTLEKIGLTELVWIRGIGAIFGVIAVAAMFYVFQNWHTRRIAWLATILFAASSWLLHSARLATPESTFLLLPLLIVIGIRLQKGDKPLITLLMTTVVGSILLYVPGLIWFIIPGAIWQRKRILDQFADVSRMWNVLLPIGFIVLLLPLAYALIMDVSLIKYWLGVNPDVTSVRDALMNVLQVPVHLAIRSDINPQVSLGRLPFLDISTTVLTAMGAYWYVFHRKLDRTKLILFGLIFSTLLSGLLLSITYSLVLPFIFLATAGGMTLLLQQWFTVFPRNPLARGVGIALVILLVALSSTYHLQRYFLAWPNAPETKQSFDLR